MAHVIVDTNVPAVANRKSEQASPTCVLTCIKKIREIQQEEYILVLDDQWQILSEYKSNLDESGQPGVGDVFLKWTLTNWSNPNRCEMVKITPHPVFSFTEFPQDEALYAFDLSDRKFVAVALAHPQKPPVLNAVDTDWWHYHLILARYGIRIEFLCLDTMQGAEIISLQTI